MKRLSIYTLEPDDDGTGDGGGTGGGSDDDASTATDKKFSQDDLDRVLKDRLARQKAQFADYDELKAKADKLAALEAENQTELERTQAALAEAEAKAAAATAAQQATARRAALISAAAEAGATKPELIYQLLKDSDGVTVNDDGTVTGATEAIETLLAANPEFVGSTTPPPVEQGARGEIGDQQIGRDALKDMSPEQVLDALKKGQLSGVLAGS